MNSEALLQVVRADGVRGRLTPEQPRPNGELQMRAVFEDGVEMLVPNATLVRQSDGTFLLPQPDQARQEGEAETPLVLPVIAETATLEKRLVDTGGVRVQKIVREHQEAIEEPLLRESVAVERVAINDWVPEGVSLAARQEGDTLIIPVVEEVVVVQKRLRLVEEIRITKTSQTVTEAQSVSLRREEIIVEELQQAVGSAEANPEQRQPS